jgi:hypothetical protein
MSTTVRTPPRRRGPALTAAAVSLLLLAGCSPDDADPVATPAVTEGASEGASEEADSVTASEPFAAIPTDGSEPGTQLDVGGPGLTEMCSGGGMPFPVDATNVSCEEYDGIPVSPDAEWGGSVGDRLEPGTYWAVLVCDGIESVEIKFDTAPGLPSAATEIPCADGGGAARVELGTVEAEATSDWGVRTRNAMPGTYLFYLVREGQTA